jgi:hypothetical protein
MAHRKKGTTARASGFELGAEGRDKMTHASTEWMLQTPASQTTRSPEHRSSGANALWSIN